MKVELTKSQWQEVKMALLDRRDKIVRLWPDEVKEPSTARDMMILCEKTYNDIVWQNLNGPDWSAVEKDWFEWQKGKV